MTTQDRTDETMRRDQDATETTGTTAEATDPPPTLRERLWSGRTRQTRILSALLAAVLLLGAAGTGWLHSGRSLLGVHAGEGALSFLPTWLPDGVAFRYDDRTVTVDELERHVDMLRALYGVTPPSGRTQMDAFRKDTAESYAVSLILDDAARERGIDIADKQARDALSRFVSERLGPGPEAYSQFIDTLADAGTSERVVLDELKRRLAMTQLFEVVTRDVGAISDQDVRDAFTARQDQLATPQRRHISNIVVATKDDARVVRQAIRDGASFAAVAKRYSLDRSTRDQGGDLGIVGRDELEEGYGTAAFAAGESALFGPVQTRYGWNIGRVEKIVPAEPARFAKIKDELKAQLRSEAILERWREWLRDVIADAGIQYADDYRPVNPDAPPDTSPVGPPTHGPGNGPR